jgi:hypothetical protein
MARRSSEPRACRRESSSNYSQDSLSDSSPHRSTSAATSDKPPGVLLCHLSSLVCLCNLTHEKGDPPSKALSLLMS